MHTRRFTPIAGLLLALAATPLFAKDVITPAPAPAPAAKPESAAPADYSTPKAAAKSFLDAVRRADTPAMKAAVFTPSDQLDAVDTFLTVLAAGTDLQKAATTQFGADGTKSFGSVSSTALQSRLAAIDAAEAHVTGDTATIMLPADPATQQSAGTILLKKIGTAWKLDGPALFGLTPANAAQNAARLDLAKKLLKIDEEVSRDITAGKYTSASDAYQDYWTRSRLAAAPSATAPSTRRSN